MSGVVFSFEAPAEHDAIVTIHARLPEAVDGDSAARVGLPPVAISCTFRHAGLRERRAMFDAASKAEQDDAQFLAGILVAWDIGTESGLPAPIDRLHIARLLDRLQDDGYDKPARAFIDAWVHSIEEAARKNSSGLPGQ